MLSPQRGPESKSATETGQRRSAHREHRQKPSAHHRNRRTDKRRRPRESCVYGTQLYTLETSTQQGHNKDKTPHSPNG